MRSGWRSQGRTAEPRSPVEMRFVDMFMTALGSLLFMAVLLSVIVGRMAQAPKPSPEQQVKQPQAPAKGSKAPASAPVRPEIVKLRIVTKSLLPGRVGEPYEVAIANRGGQGVVRWSRVEGRGTLPPGVSFDEDGTLQGVPSATGEYAFYVQIADTAGNNDTALLRMAVSPRLVSAERIHPWIAAALFLAFVYFAWRSLGRFRGLGKVIGVLEMHHLLGETDFTFGDENHRQTIKLPEGIDKFKSDRIGARTTAVYAILVTLASGGYLAWALWQLFGK